jgi:hypothetical protein
MRAKADSMRSGNSVVTHFDFWQRFEREQE